MSERGRERRSERTRARERERERHGRKKGGRAVATSCSPRHHCRRLWAARPVQWRGLKATIHQRVDARQSNNEMTRYTGACGTGLDAWGRQLTLWLMPVVWGFFTVSTFFAFNYGWMLCTLVRRRRRRRRRRLRRVLLGGLCPGDGDGGRACAVDEMGWKWRTAVEYLAPWLAWVGGANCCRCGCWEVRAWARGAAQVWRGRCRMGVRGPGSAC